MEPENVLDCRSAEEFRKWLEDNHSSQKECWVNCKRGKIEDGEFSYIDAVYVALSFGWIDSTYAKIDGVRMQRFSPRRKNSHWSELNKERCRWLIDNDLMAESGFRSLPDLDEEFVIDSHVLEVLKSDEEVWKNFSSFPELYRRIKISNIQKEKNKDELDRKLANFMKSVKKGQMAGNWNDSGRLQ